MMAYIIDKARIKQRSVVIALLDLKNAFGEFHHRLIKEVLAHHHIPLETKTLISSLYDNFFTSIITDEFVTPAIPVNRGVLQGDCLSPLLFNMCFNTFIQFIRQEKYKQLGSLHMMKMIDFLTQLTGFNLLTMQRWLQLMNEKINSS